METASSFLGLWDQYMFVGAVACIAGGILILLYHELKSDPDQRLQGKV